MLSEEAVYVAPGNGQMRLRRNLSPPPRPTKEHRRSDLRLALSRPTAFDSAARGL